ncbi:hypothetical protein MPTK1_2g10220 [Marchantia polymorpha subsp. ruderalis]|nr:hypothetical protein Mp_2g10220 [Marchantia polymorpha subsp. ruderalis]
MASAEEEEPREPKPEPEPEPERDREQAQAQLQVQDGEEEDGAGGGPKGGGGGGGGGGPKRRVSFRDGGERAESEEAEMRVFRLKVYYSEAWIEGALKTYPQTKVASITSRTLANRSNFLNSIRKKLVAVGVNPHTRLSLSAVPPVPADRDYSIAHWLRKFPGAAMVVSPEHDSDALFRQLLTLNGHPVARNPLYQLDPDDSPINPSPSPATIDQPSGESSSSTTTTTTLPSPEAATGCESEEARLRRELSELQDEFSAATSQLARLEKAEASKDVMIQLLDARLDESSMRLRAMEQAEASRRNTYSARLSEVYRRMFLEAVRSRVRCRMQALLLRPSPMDLVAAPYDEVLAACARMDDFPSLMGLSLEDLALTALDSPSPQPVHASDSIHIGVYAEMVHAQDARLFPAYCNLFVFLYNQHPQTVLDNLISCWI